MSLLGDLAHGRERASAILIEDSTEQNGRHLLKGLISSLALKRSDTHVVITDITKWAWLEGMPEEIGKKIVCHEYDYDPWSDHSRILSVDSFLYQSSGQDPVLAIDNLSSLLQSNHYTHICQVIHTLASKYSTVLLLLHYDLHDDHVIKGLHHTVSSVVRVTPLDDRKPATKSFDGVCEILHKRTTGKILRQKQWYGIGDGYRINEREIPSEDGVIEQNPGLDPTENLTFDLRLTKQQRAAKSRVVLPYTQAADQSSGGGKVIYHYDDGDDWDESDPDDDLDV